jgi:hypothetical protein
MRMMIIWKDIWNQGVHETGAKSLKRQDGVVTALLRLFNRLLLNKSRRIEENGRRREEGS